MNKLIELLRGLFAKPTAPTHKELSMNRQRLIDQLVFDEGVVHEIYLDHLGYPTFGVGHLIVEGDEEYGLPVGTPVEPSRVSEVFERDVDKYIGYTERAYADCWDTLPGEVKEILVNMCFNLGPSRLSKFKNMNAAIRAGDWKTAAVEGRDSRWHKQVPNRAERLMVRLEMVE